MQKDVSCLVQGDMDIASYDTKAKQLWDESKAVSGVPRCTCGKCECEVNVRLHKYTEDQKLIQFLMGLNSSYTAIKGNILMMTPFPSISQAYSLLVQEERQRQLKTEAHFLNENASLSAAINKQNPQQENWRNNQMRLDSKRTQLFCDHCKRSGHTVESWYKIHGYPNNSNRPQGRGRGGHGISQGRRAYNTWTESDKQYMDIINLLIVCKHLRK